MSGETAVADVSRLQALKGQWTWHLAALSTLIAVILFLFRYEAVSAVEVWWIYPTYSHCFLIIPISLWLVWGMRDELLATTPELAPKALLLIPLILAGWLMAKLATVNEARQFAVVALVQVAILSMLGTRIYRMILFPALFLFFLVPVGQYLVQPMQVFATRFTDIGLTLLGVPHYTEGTLIELANGRFEVAEACAGLRFLIATMTLGVLFCHLTYRKWYKIGLFLVSCVVVPLIGNGFRCLGIIMLAHLTDNRIAVGADHLVYGWVFNMAILAVLFFIGVRFRDATPERQTTTPREGRASSHAAVLSVALGAALVISAGPALAYLREARPVSVNQAALNAPLVAAGWIQTGAAKDWSPDYTGPDGQMRAAIVQESSGGPAVDVAVEYYGRMRERHSLVAATNRLWDRKRWHVTARASAAAAIGKRQVRFAETQIVSGNTKRLIWSAYWMDGRFTTSPLAIKLLQIKTALTGNEGSALLAISTPIDGALDDARARLAASLDALGGMQDRLIRAGKPSHASHSPGIAQN